MAMPRKEGKWTLILDNTDDDNVLLQEMQASGSSNGPTQPLLAYLPQSQNGSVLITTRAKSVALRLAEESDIIPIEPMNDTDALALLEKKLGKYVDRNNTPKLAAALEFMPLAIVQAAAYIQQKAPRCSVRQYVKEFYKNDKKKTCLLNHEAGHLRRDLEAKNSIIITWQISFDYIHRIKPSAANLLSLMSFFDRQGIPEALLKTQNKADIENLNRHTVNYETDDQKSDQDEDAGEFEADIQILRDYSFISISVDESTFEMHGLVQLATRKWLEANDQLERWKQQYIKNLCAEFPTGEYENWRMCQALYPHARSAVAQQPVVESSLQEWASILYCAAWYACAKGNYDEAQTMALKATKTREKVLGKENEETLSSLHMLALIYSYSGRWKEAEKLQVQAMEASIRVLGQEHPGTLIIIGDLAWTYADQGRWEEAEELGVQVMEKRKKVMGKDHPETLTSIDNLAKIYGNQGRWGNAENLQLRVIETCKKIRRENHPETLTAISHLALTYSGQGRWIEAEELEVQVMETSKKMLGQDHPDTLTSINNLAVTYRNQRRWKKAEELQLQVLEIEKKKLREDHPDTLTVMNNLALIYG